MTFRLVASVLLTAVAMTAPGCNAETDTERGVQPVAADLTSHLGRGINLGNKLEAPAEGEWGSPVESWMVTTIAEGGFATVRVPVRWSAHADTIAPYTIDDEFIARITWVVDQALAAGLRVVLNVHHYQEIFTDPHGERERFLALWQQIATHFNDRPDGLLFEALNEPHDSLTAERWNALFPEALAVIRETNPDRDVIVGTAEWGGIGAMAKLQLPDDDHLIFTFHYYEPFAFTHQGAEWVDGADEWLGTTWGTPEDRAAVQRDFDAVAAWAADRGLAVFLGEFGAYARAPMDARVAWTEFVRHEAERRGFSWAYWEFDAGFGAFGDGQWNELHGALTR
jgi:endoglucanase